MSYTPADLPSLVGKELFCSDWLELSRSDEKAFGDATFLRESFLGRPPDNGDPYGDTLVSGFLLLSLVVAFHKRHLGLEQGSTYGLNYGVDKVRFLRPVRTGERIRLRATLLDVLEKGPGHTRVLTRNELETEGGDGPAMVADWIALFVDPEAAGE